MDFLAPLGAFFITILLSQLSQDRKSVKTDKTGGPNADVQETQIIFANIHE
jgi:hypothetical protein